MPNEKEQWAEVIGKISAAWADDVGLIHELHEAHGDSRHCNYCGCHCSLCKAEGWKYRDLPFNDDGITFVKGDKVRFLKAYGTIAKAGDFAVYEGWGKFTISSGRHPGVGITFATGKQCVEMFQSLIVHALPIPHEPSSDHCEEVPFGVGETLICVEADETFANGDLVTYMGHRKFKVLSGRHKGAEVGYFGNGRCSDLFERIAQ